MEPSTRTGDVEGTSVPAAPDADVENAHDAPTARLDAPTAPHRTPAAHPAPTGEGEARTENAPPASDAPTKEVRPSMLGSIHEQCSACGAPMASDQRYCLRCGERNGPARVPALDRAGQRTQAAPAAGPPRRPRTSVNTALIAGVGTLLLALGVGVLIGRSSNSSSSKTPAAQVITVPTAGGSAGTAGTGTTGGASTPGASARTPGAAAAKASKSNAAAGSAAAAAAAAAATKAAAKAKGPPPKVVTVGSPGKGPGYQKGHFTGNFFGGEEPEEK
jgi:hypothetical protein